MLIIDIHTNAYITLFIITRFTNVRSIDVCLCVRKYEVRCPSNSPALFLVNFLPLSTNSTCVQDNIFPRMCLFVCVPVTTYMLYPYALLPPSLPSDPSNLHSLPPLPVTPSPSPPLIPEHCHVPTNRPQPSAPPNPSTSTFPLSQSLSSTMQVHSLLQLNKFGLLFPPFLPILPFTPISSHLQNPILASYPLPSFLPPVLPIPPSYTRQHVPKPCRSLAPLAETRGFLNTG